MTTVPRVSIGLPVYNGANFIRDAIASVLQQTYPDFELIIRDNASTDQTEAICRDFARVDRRIRYIRGEINIGAGPNFNAIVPEARGEFFKWIAHDDVLLPTFLERCVEALDAHHTGVLASPSVRFIDAAGQHVGDYTSPFNTSSPDRAVRFSELFRGHRCFEVFGIIRTAALRQTRLIGNYNHGDGVLLAHLVLLGRFIEVSEPLFLSRRHEQQSMYRFGITSGAGVDLDGYARWFDPKNGRVPRSFNRMLADYTSMIRRTRMPARERVACYRVVSRWLGVSWRILAGEWKRTAYDLCGIPIRARQADGDRV
jgi:glycosyltransferase involved in cell wall biosynthesis